MSVVHNSKLFQQNKSKPNVLIKTINIDLYNTEL